MLVLARKLDEQIVINPGQWDEVVIVVVAIERGEKVRLGIAAHPDVIVNRREVQDAIERGRGGA